MICLQVLNVNLLELGRKKTSESLGFEQVRVLASVCFYIEGRVFLWRLDDFHSVHV